MTVQDESATTTHGVVLTDAAATGEVAAGQEGRDDPGTASPFSPAASRGLRNNLFFDDRTSDGDLTVDFSGVT